MKDLYDLTGYMDRNSKNGTHKFYIALVEKLLMQYGTIELIKKYIPELEKAGIEVNYKSEPDKGISDAFNKGIQRSSGDIIGIINSDDSNV